jgi:hypothetical protein
MLPWSPARPDSPAARTAPPVFDRTLLCRRAHKNSNVARLNGGWLSLRGLLEILGVVGGSKLSQIPLARCPDDFVRNLVGQLGKLRRVVNSHGAGCQPAADCQSAPHCY